jgi:CrcB protein
MLTPTVYVALGGVAGVLLRYGLTFWFQSLWTVMAINLAGSFLLGALVHLGVNLSHDLRNGIAVGFLGGFTTFSTMAVQTVLEAEGGRPMRAAAYFLVSAFGGLACALLFAWWHQTDEDPGEISTEGALLAGGLGLFTGGMFGAIFPIERWKRVRLEDD